jgi:hypothetical protein
VEEENVDYQDDEEVVVVVVVAVEHQENVLYLQSK